MTVQRYVPMHALEGKRAETMNYAAIGGIILTITMAVFGLVCVAYQAGKRDGREALLQERAELRSLRRAEARAPHGRHHAAAFPGDDEIFERMPHDTGELRVLAETGDIQGIRNLNAAFFRTIGLREWTRKRAGAA